MACFAFSTAGVYSTVLPTDWNGTGSRIICIGGGGAGRKPSNSTTLGLQGHGGGGGAYAEISGSGLSAGATINFQVGSSGARSTTAGTNGGNGTATWINISSASAPTSTFTGTGIANSGCLADFGRGGSSTSTTTNAGGSSAANLGTINYSGGAGSPWPTVTLGRYAGGGGGSAGGFTPQPGTVGLINSPSGTGGNGGAAGGTAGSGGSGGAGSTTTTAGAGQQGSVSSIATVTMNAPAGSGIAGLAIGTVVGPYGGYGGGGSATTGQAGAGGGATGTTAGWGAGGGGGGNNNNTLQGNPGSGGVGLVIFIYTPVTTSVTSLNVSSGTTFGGTAVTITGTGFVGTLTSVTFNGIAATGGTIVNSTTITCTTGRQTTSGTNGTGNVVVVTTTGGTATGTNLWTYTTAAPTFTSVTNAGGNLAGGNTVTIVGTNFVQTGFSVTFGGTAATSIVYSNVGGTQITCTVPAGAAAGTVAIVIQSITTGSSPNGGTQSVTAASAYRYLGNSRYWVGGTGNWGTTTTNWSDASGGTAYTFAAPDSTNDVFFDSGVPVVTISSATCRTLTISVAITLASSSTNVSIFGGLAVTATITNSSYTGAFVFSATSSSFTFASTSSLYALTFSGAGGTFTQSGTITCTSVITITAATTVAFNNSVTCQRYVVTGASATVTYTSATFTITGNGVTVIDGTILTNYTGSTGLTASTFNCNYSGATGTRTIVWGTTGGSEGKSLPVNITAGGDIVTFTAGSTIKSLNFTGFTGLASNGWSTTNISLYGNLTIPSGIIISGTGLLTFSHTSGTATITSGTTYPGGITQNSPGGTVALGSNVTIAASQTYTLTAGTLNLSTFVLSTGIFSSSNANTRAITFSGGGYIALSHVGSGTSFGAGTNLIVMTTLTGMTYNGSSRFDYTAAAGSGGTSRDISTSTLGYGSTGGSTSLLLNVNITAGSDNINLNSSNFFGSIIFQSGYSGRCTASPTSTIVLYGSLTTSANMVYMIGTQIIYWSHTSGTVDWTSNGIPWGFRPTISGTGGTVRLVDNVTFAFKDPPFIQTNGATQYVTSTCGLNNIGTGDFTIEFWWNVTAGDKYIFLIYSATVAKNLYFNYSSSTLIVSNDVTQVTSSSLAAYVGLYIHVAYVRSSGSCKLYINGTQSGSTYSPDTHNYDTATDIYVGKSGVSAVFHAVVMSNLRITQAAVYTGNFTPDAANKILSRFQPAKTNTIALTGTEVRLLTFQNYSAASLLFDNSINQYTVTNNSATLYDATQYGDFTLTAGTLNLNDNILTINGTFSSDNSNTRNISTGTNARGYIKILHNKTGTVTVWNAATLTNFTTTGQLSVYFDQGPISSGSTDENKSILHGSTAGGSSSTAISIFPYVGTGSAVWNGGYTITGVFNDLAFNWAPLYSMSFNGTTQYISTASNAVFTCTGDFTVEGWYYPTTVSGSDRAIFCLGTETTNRYVWYITSAGQIASNLFGASTVTYTVTTITVNTWNHIAVVRSGSTVKVFLNGIESITTDTQAGTIGNGVVNIGADAGGTAKFVGYISNFRMVKGVAVYKQTSEPDSSSSITMSYSFTSNIATAVVNNVTIVGNPGSGTTGGTGSVTGTYSTLSSSGNITGGTGGQPYGSSNQFGGGGGGINGGNSPSPGSGVGGNTYLGGGTGQNQGTSPYTLLQAYNTALGTSLTSIGGGGGGGTSGGSTNGVAGTFIGGGGGGVGGGYSGALGGTGANAGIVLQYQIINDSTVYAAVINSSGVVSGGGGGVTISGGVATFPSTISSIRVWCIGRGANGTNGNAGFLSQAGGGAGGTGWAVFSGFNDFSLTTTSQGVSATQVKLLTAKSATIIDTSSYPVLINNIGTVTAGNTIIPFANTYSYQFNGTSQYLTFSGSTNFQFNGDFTIEFYLRVNSIATTQTILDQYQGTTTANGNWKIYVDTAGKINVNYDGSSSFITTSAVISINTWYHIAFHRFSNTFSLYVAGVRQALTGTTTFSSTFGYIPNNSNDAIWIGAQQLSGPTAYLNGYISNLRIVNGDAVYITNFTPPSTTLQATQSATGDNIAAISDPASTSLIACHLPVVRDGSVNNITLTNNGTATITAAYAPKFINSSSGETSDGFIGYLKVSSRTLYGSLSLSTDLKPVTSLSQIITFSGSSLQLLSSYNNTTTTTVAININNSTANVKLNHNLFYSFALFLTHSAGTLDLNNLTLSCYHMDCSGVGNKTLVTGTLGRLIANTFIGASTLTVTGSGILDVKATFTGAGISYPTLRAIGNLTITGANTITTLTNYPTTGIPTLTLPSSTTQTVTSLNVRGNPSSLLYIRSSTSGTAATISDTTGTNNLYYVDVKDITVSGGATFNRDTNTTVANTNITGFTATSLNPTTAATGNFITFFYGS